jgi:hypothetical protein
MSGEMITMRSTTIYPKNEVSLCNFLTGLGFKARNQYRDEYIKCGSVIVGKYDYNTRELIRAFKLPTEKGYHYYTGLNHDSLNWYVKEYFKLYNTDKISISVDVDYGRIKISTYSTTKNQHKTIVRKVYCPLKEFDPNTSYNCEYERSSSECLR